MVTRRALWVLAMTLIAATAGAEPTQWIFHFHPDTAPVRAQRFKAAADAFVQRIDPNLRVQPFRHERDLVRALRDKPPAFVILGPRHIRRYQNRLGLTPLLVPVRHGRTAFRKRLLAREGVDTRTLMGLSVAATSLRTDNDFTAQLGHLKLERADMRVMSVSKDADALLALALHRVQLALVRPESVDRMRQIHQSAARGLVLVDTTPSMPHPLLCATRRADPQLVERVTAGFQNAIENAAGQRLMRSLVFDLWIPPPFEKKRRRR